MLTNPDFDHQIDEALSQELIGWDFTWFNQHTKETPLPWDYRSIVLDRMRGIKSLLDIGTGGGEFLAALAPLPENTWATEGYPPNVNVACQRLEPIGVRVADISALHNRLPFDPDTFDLVIDRHEGFDSREVYRVLRTGGRMVTQQVGGENCTDLNRFLQDEPYFRYASTTLARWVGYLEDAGFQIIDQREDFPTLTFLDIASVVFYLKVITWQIEDFSIEKYRDKLFKIYQAIAQTGGFAVKEHRFLIESVKSKKLLDCKL